MNKKFLSAILFGALMVTSTGTFVSCKDYDDDIENLQGQIDKNSSAIAELQKLVGAGNWVTSISPVQNGFTVTMSNGQSQTITGINGADGKDGKNGTEWTIGEDGFWYMDGEKTDNVAVGKNGENGQNGVTAPSPTIGADGNWVLYTWDAEKGEFVAEATEIPAQGTAAYAVEANGVYTLHIADANGEYMEIVLPGTSDSFVVSALSTNQTIVEFESAKWNPAISNKYYKEIVKAFPEVADIEKKSIIKQGGNLPVLVNPANVELTNDFNFSLQTIKGEVLDIAVANPQKGLIGDYELSEGDLTSRVAKSEDCIWTLSIDPAYDEKAKAYVGTEEEKPAALVVENVKGTVVKTAFAYQVEANDLTDEDVTINTVAGQGEKSEKTVSYAETIDLFAEDVDTKDIPVALDNEYTGHYIITLADELEVEEMGLSIAEDGHTLNITDMPARELEKDITLNVIALGLNGSVAENTVTLTVKQEIAGSTDWADKEVTLKVNSAGTFTQSVLWDVTEYEFSATQKNQLYNAIPSIEVSYIDEETELPVVKLYAVGSGLLKKKANGTSDATGYADWTYLGFTLDAADYMEREYDVLIKFMNSDNTAVVYSAAATLNVKNPELGATYVKLVPGFVDENGVYQITGTPKTLSYSTISLNDVADIVTYPLENALILGKGAAIKEIIDLDNANYTEEGRDDEAFEMHKLVKETLVSDDPDVKTWVMTVNQWAYQWETLQPKWRSDIYNQLYKTRNIRAMISLFGNPDNVVPFDFQVEVKSEVYTDTPADAITFDATKLVNVFGQEDDDDTDADESVIDIKAAITKAVLQAGTDKGKTYNLFASQADGTDASTTYTYDYRIHTNTTNTVVFDNDFNDDHFNAEKVSDDLHYLLNASGDLVAIDEADLKKFGMSAVEYADRDGDSKKVYIAFEDQYSPETDGTVQGAVKNIKGLQTLYTSWRKYYHADGTKATYKSGDKVLYEANDKETVDDADAVAVELYNKYVANTTQKVYVAYETKTTTDAVDGDITRDDRIDYVKIYFDEPEVAAIYFDSVASDGVVFYDENGTDANALSDVTITPVTEAPNSVTGGQVKVDMTLEIRDAWGMIMKVPFQVTVKTSAN